MKILKTASGKQTVKMSKSEWQSIGKKAGWMKTAEKTYIVVDDEFNQAHYSDIIGQTFENPPSYAHVKVVEQNDDSAEENDDEVNRRRSIKVEFSDGDHLYTDINGTKQEWGG